MLDKICHHLVPRWDGLRTVSQTQKIQFIESGGRLSYTCFHFSACVKILHLYISFIVQDQIREINLLTFTDLGLRCRKFTLDFWQSMFATTLVVNVWHQTVLQDPQGPKHGRDNVVGWLNWSFVMPHKISSCVRILFIVHQDTVPGWFAQPLF